MNINIDDGKLDYLDQVAQIVAGLQEMEAATQKMGDHLPQDKQALLELGEAYMFLYNIVLDNLSEYR